MYARNYSLGSWHESLDKAHGLQKKSPPKMKDCFHAEQPLTTEVLKYYERKQTGLRS